MEQLLLTWIRNSDGSNGMKLLSSIRCPNCQSMNVRWWDLDGDVRSYKCGDCNEIGVVPNGREDNALTRS
jgi:DNA-directed RNA polymerase subunit RPC12/RpoP